MLYLPHASVLYTVGVFPKAGQVFVQEGRATSDSTLRGGGCTIAFAATVVTMWLQDADFAVGPTRELLRWLNAVAFGAGFPPENPLWHQTKYIGGLWFLLALFWARPIVAIIDRHIRPLPLRLTVVVALAVLGVATSEVVWLPWSIQPGMCAAMFVWSGSRLKDLNTSSANEARLRYSGVFWVVTVAAWIVSIGSVEKVGVTAAR